MRASMRLLLPVLCLLAASQVAIGASRPQVERMFSAWMQDELWPAARARGVSATTFNRAMSGIRLDWDLPDLVPPGTRPGAARRQSQAEFGSPAAYFSERRLQGLAATGRALAGRWGQVLGAVERRYGVPGRIVLAIWGRESGFGRADIPHSALRVLSTKAFMSTRRELFLEELLAALTIVERGHVSAEAMKSSWAGAMGQPQFMPSSFLEHAVDFDGDGRADIWSSVPDTLGSIAHYLSRKGWVPGRDWGYEVTVPANVSCALEGPDQARPIADWVGAGIRRVSGKPFPAEEMRRPGMLLMPAGRSGPAFVVTPNFYVLKAYNNSDLYALFVGNTADRIAYGAGPFRAGWGRVDTLLRSDIAAMQRRLEAKGHDVGGADGLPGYKTRRSIGAWQAGNGRAPTCFPSAEIVQAVR